MHAVLLAEKNDPVIGTASAVLEERRWTQNIFHDGASAFAFMSLRIPDIIFASDMLPDMDGLTFLAMIKKDYTAVPVVLLSAGKSCRAALQAGKLGALDFIPRDGARLPEEIRRIIDGLTEKKENEAALHHPVHPVSMVFQSPVMKQINNNITKLASSDASVLIFGESGTGKELIARSIHDNSPRNEHPFIPVDCVAYPATLLESELFGYEKGAFTDAAQQKPGVFELADRGTLFFDEITEMEYHMQPKLLRVIQERQFRRLGGKALVNADVRIISATNRDPEEAVKENRLREDLYYRLNVIPVFIPPLRDRKEDIPLLVHHFIRKHSLRSPVAVRSVSPEALKTLAEYHWPGNIRELENTVQRIMSFIDHDTVEPEDIPATVKPEALRRGTAGSYHEAREENLKTFNREYFTSLLKEHNGNMSHVAGAAGIGRKTLYRIFKHYRLSRTL